MQPGTSPLQLSTNYFSNQYIEVLSSVSFQLSTVAEAQLSTAAINATAQQTALLTHGLAGRLRLLSSPSTSYTRPIAMTWAQPATNLEAIQTAPNLNRLLNADPSAFTTTMVVPGYTVTPTGGAAKLTMDVVRTSESEVTVSVSGETAFSISIGDFFGISTSASASYFSDSIVTSANTVQIAMSFPGVNLINFGPVSFDLTTGQNWF